jgi:hypothetical protein
MNKEIEIINRYHEMSELADIVGYPLVIDLLKYYRGDTIRISSRCKADLDAYHIREEYNAFISFGGIRQSKIINYLANKYHYSYSRIWQIVKK